MANAGLSKTKRRIQSVKSTQKLTKAMGMIAAVKLRRYQNAYANGLEYEEECRQFMGELFLHDKDTGSHYGKPNEGAEGFLYILLTSNMGLCAAYNSELYKFIDERIKPGDSLLPVGLKGAAHYAHNTPKGVHLIEGYAEYSIDLSDEQILEATSRLRNAFNAGKYQRIYLIYTKYVNSLTFKPYRFQLLPIQMPAYQPPADEEYRSPVFEPEARRMIHELMPLYLSSMLHHRFDEAHLAEQASRRNAMDQANDNAGELIDKLTIEYNKARQGAITQELIEVVTGSQGQN
ncbi:MAG: ATP synthase F1 subunit gamma [Bacillota bacterium]|nr:ATP synthase F1 subunit gamma [Bacillota bacterium]